VLTLGAGQVGDSCMENVGLDADTVIVCEFIAAPQLGQYVVPSWTALPQFGQLVISVLSSLVMVETNGVSV